MRILMMGLSGILLVSKVYSQAIKGRVTDDQTGEVLVGATVSITDTEAGTITDASGNYYLPLASSGVYGVTVSFVGYQKAVYPEVWVKNQAIVDLNVRLSASYSDLDEVVISERREVSTPGRLVITEEQISRFASTYYDPARMATTVPDAVVTNDQNNRISVRGIPPAYNTWRLEGAEILNPNHLSNAGTFSDQPTATGGGVNILSAQMMSNSSFLYGHMTAGNGNTVGGLFDMQMKVGNTEKNQYVAQASLIGLDFAVDGPLTKTSKATFALNYRYSFTGILAAFGVDFGGERIGFQDLSFSLNFPVNDRTTFKVFGLGGLNYNKFDGVGSARAQEEKDLYNIDFGSGMGAMGLSITSGLKGLLVSNTVLGSGLTDSRKQSLKSDGTAQKNAHDYYLVSDHFSISKMFGNTELETGFIFNHYYFLDKSNYSGIIGPVDFSWSSNKKFERNLFNPYLQSRFNFNEKLSLNAGVSNSNLLWSKALIDFRGSLEYVAQNSTVIAVNAGQYSAVYQPSNFLFDSDLYYYPSRGFIRSQRFSVDVNKASATTNFNLSGFFYHFPRAQFLFDSVPQSTSRIGFSFMTERFFSHNMYFRVGASTYSPLLESPYEYDHVVISNLSVSMGKTWELKRKNQLQINLRTLENMGFDRDSDPHNLYFRADLRVVWIKSKEKTTRSLSLDIQNVSNHQNLFYKDFDSVQNQELVHYQLGLIPILTYRVDF